MAAFTALQVADTIEAAGFARPTDAEAQAVADWLTQGEIDRWGVASINLMAQMLPIPAIAAPALDAYAVAAQPRPAGLRADACWPPAWTYERFGRPSAGALSEAA